jgi:hypothetical protein
MKGSDLREAPRFKGDVPVLTEGGEGVTRDLSGSGIFFETDGSFSTGQPIEFSIILEHLYPDRPVRLQCKGSVVRVEKKGQKVGVATTIDSYTIVDHVQ